MLVVITGTACTQSNKFTSLTPREFKTEIEKENTQLIDVRTAEEHAQEHISGSINIDVKQEDFIEKATATLNKEKTVALYCRSGRRSKTAAAQLSQAGFNVVELDSGYNTWKENSTLLVTHEIKHLLNSYIKKSITITDSTEREKLLNNILVDYDNLCKKHEKEIKEFVEKANSGNKEALEAKTDIETILYTLSTNLSK